MIKVGCLHPDAPQLGGKEKREGNRRLQRIMVIIEKERSVQHLVVRLLLTYVMAP